ncbi:transcription factor A, mitochondrial [Pelomyxa schiedti]|nr:transcription factor A, mitochondrial [Pelomyxa schiedti]
MMEGDKQIVFNTPSGIDDDGGPVIHFCDPTTNNSMPDVVVSAAVSDSRSSSALLSGMQESACTVPVKRYKTAYILFHEQKRDEVRKYLGPNASFAAVAKAIAQRWKALSEPEKRPFVLIAEEQKRAYLQQKQNSATKITNNSAEAHPEEDTILGVQKRPMNKYAYFLFAREKRDEVRKSLGPSAREYAVTQHLTRLWKEMSALDKKPFTDLAEQQKNQLPAQSPKAEPIKEDAESSEEERPTKPTKRPPLRVTKDPNHPKRPKPAYLIFVGDRRPGFVAATPGMRPVEYMKKLGEMWKSMSPEDKQPFVAKAEAEKQRYQKDMEEYNLNLANKTEERTTTTCAATVPSKRIGVEEHSSESESSQSSSDSESDTKEKPIRKHIKLDPLQPKRPKAAFMFFCEHRILQMKASHPTMNVCERLNTISTEWKDMPPQQKQPFVDQAQADKLRYEHDVKAYKASQNH